VLHRCGPCRLRAGLDGKLLYSRKLYYSRVAFWQSYNCNQIRTKLNRKERLLFLTPPFVLAWPLWTRLRQDQPDVTMRRLAGASAIDCGVSDGLGDIASQCAYASIKQKALSWYVVIPQRSYQSAMFSHRKGTFTRYTPNVALGCRGAKSLKRGAFRGCK
jgi:hypothetical protein